MADALIKAWHGVFDRGTKQAQERLKKAHGHKPEFQAFLKSRGIEGGERSAKQATTSLKKATDTKVAAQKIADMRFKKALQASSDRVREMGRRRREGGEGLGGSLETTKDVIAHIKQYGSIKAGRLGEAMDRTQLIGKVAKDIEKKKAATKIVDRLKTISYGRGAGLNPAKDMKLNPSSPLKTDMSALSNKRHSMNYEEVQIDEVSKAEAEKVLGGAVKEKPKMPPGKQPAGYRYVRGLARKAMKTAMKKEDVEQIDEFVDRETRLAARTAETGSSTRVSSGDVLGRRGGHETPKQAIARRVGKDFYGIKSGGKTSIYNRSPKPNLPEEAEQVDEVSQKMVRAYRDKAQDDLEDAKDNRAYFKAHNDNTSYEDDKIRKRTAGIKLATKKIYGGAKVRMREEVVTEAEGTVAVTPKEKSLAAHHGDPKKITYGDVIKARLKSAAAKKMGK